MSRRVEELDTEELAELKERYEAGEPFAHLRDEFGFSTHLTITQYARQHDWKRALVDLKAMEWDFRQGILTNSEIARKYNTTRQAVHQFSVDRRWERDLDTQIREQSAARVREQIAIELDEAIAAKEGELREEAIVEANAVIQSKITRQHQIGASTARDTALKLMREMGALAIPEEELMQFVLLAAERRVANIDDFDKQAEARDKAINTFLALINLPSRSTTIKNLVNALVQSIEIERKVYGIKDAVGETDVTKALRELADDA